MNKQLHDSILLLNNNYRRYNKLVNNNDINDLFSDDIILKDMIDETEFKGKKEILLRISKYYKYGVIRNSKYELQNIKMEIKFDMDTIGFIELSYSMNNFNKINNIILRKY